MLPGSQLPAMPPVMTYEDTPGAIRWTANSKWGETMRRFHEKRAREIARKAEKK